MNKGEDKIGCAQEWKTKTAYFVLSFYKIGYTRQFVSTLTLRSFALSFHSLALSLNKIDCISTIKTSELVLYCLRFALSLQNNPETDISI